MRSLSKMTVLDQQAFAASTLSDSKGLAEALRILESCLAGPDHPLDLIVQDLCSAPHLFEFIISALPSGREFVSRIMDAYPTDPALIEASYTTALLQRLTSSLFSFPPYLFSTLTALQIGQDKVYVENALPVLYLLCSTDFSTDVTPTTNLEDPEHELSEFSVYKKPRKSKHKTPTIEAMPFHKLGAKLPSSSAEASRMACEILDDLRMTLKFCLEQLLEPSLARHLKDTYISTSNDTVVCPAIPQNVEVPEVVAIEPKPSAHPKIEPLKVALNFENADELGEWHVIVGSNAIKKLREFANRDKKKCNIVLKKIRQLSNGHFSDENQKRLNGPSGVPIFEAKMQRDLRLVYQVDVIPDHDGSGERQVIKIYGIYTHTQLHRIWDTIGRHLAGKGEEYNRRCACRIRSDQHDSDVYLPACFPSEDFERDTEPISLALPDEDKGEVHSLLVLDKYITFSRAFYHSLIANEDVQHVFELHPHEHKIVECNTSCYVLGRSGTGKTTTMVFKMLGIEHAWKMQVSDRGIPKPRQAFVTKSPVLAEKVKEYFSKLLRSLVLDGYSLGDLKTIRAQNTASGVGAKVRHGVNIPKKFSLLEEQHFPLFVTFDELVRMIAADVLCSGDPEAQRTAKIFVDTDEVEAQDSFVTYNLFARTYWPHFPHQLVKDLEPWVVFSEFMGVIKGSEKSLSCSGGFLDETTYCSLSARTNPTFAEKRQTLYALFRVYCKLKKERRHHDVADRTHAILKALLGGTPLEGQRVDYLYVDEAQDNLLIDALLLRLICSNPEGLFWAGDTAQTISAGSSFRFDDLKAFLYRIERERGSHLIQDRSVANPSVFQLAVNYRSHGGIVNCAHTVIERIMHFWPDAIDRLKPEHGIVDGLKPVFFRGWDQDAAQCEQFLFGKSESRIEFGAHQCILVRDENARKNLRQKTGKMVRIMTLYDSKGLEFNDVLLYNFFEDSPIDLSRWSVLLNNADGEVDGKNLANVYAPSFARDEGRFAGVCSELKLLYVGITRARKNLWIFDKSEKSEPMRMIWSSRDQIKNCTPEMGVPHLAESSDPAEWASSGYEMLQLEKYSHAMECFTNASLPRMVALCESFHCRESAYTKVESRKAQQDAFLVAANAILAATDALTASDAPSEKDKLWYYRSAAECYVRAGDNQKAATVYLSAQEYDLAARRFRKAGLFDKTLEVLHRYSQKISSACSEELYTVCRLFYCRTCDGKKPRWPLFPTESLEEEEQFLKDYDLDVARAELLESHGRNMEAAELHLSEDRPFDAIKDFLKEKGSHEATQRATRILLDGLWQRCSFAIPPKEVAADQDVTELLSLARELNVDFMDPLDRYEISMFQAISDADLASLEVLANKFIKANKKAAALLALDHFFSQLPELASYNIHEMTSFLATFLEYARLLHSIIYYLDPLGAGAGSIRRLFCIREEPNAEYSLQLGSFLHSSATSDPDGSLYSQDSVAALSKNDVVSALRKCLTERLRERVLDENMLCRATPLFSQCLTFVMTDRCNFPDCVQDHVKHEELDPKRYNLQLGAHLQQISILQLMFSVNPYPLVPSRAMMLEWLTYLYEALKPKSHVQGSIANFDLSLIPGAHEGMHVMKSWVREALYKLRPGRRDFLTTVLRLTSLLFTFDKSNALDCINKAHFSRHARRIPQFIYPDGHYIVEDVVKIFDGTQYNCISAGLKFLSHVLKSSESIDLSVFCDCLEDTIGKICISWRLSFPLPLDGLVLPRAWHPASDISSKKGIWIALTGASLDCVKDLLIHLQSNTPSTIYTVVGANLTPTLRSIFISRICRALCFLIYNVTNRDVRQKVRDIFSALRPAGPTQRAHPMYRKYVETPENEYLRVVVGYDIEAKVVIEDLVQLLHKQRDPLRTRPLRMLRIKDIHFASPSEVPSLVLSSRLVVARSELRVDAPAFVPRNVPQTEQEPDVKEVQEVQEEPATDEPALINEHEPTSQEISAAMKILTAYRSYRKRCEELAHAFGRGIEAQKNMLFCKCLKNVYASNWGKSTQRNLYIWALPRLVVFVDKVVAVTQELKDQTKRQLAKGNHEHLEELGIEMNNRNALVNQARLLQEKIEPDAIARLPLSRVRATIKKAVSDVQDIIHRLPDKALGVELGDPDFGFAYKFAMFGSWKRQAPRPKRPILNTEDLPELAYY